MLKKISLLLITLFMVFSLTACGSKNVKGTLPDIMDKVYKKLDSETKSKLENIEVTKENIYKFIGTKKIEYKEALASEYAKEYVAYSVVLIRANNEEDVESIKTTIKENINPNKWISVWVEEEDVIIKSKGDLIIVIVVADEDTRKTIEKGFDRL